MSSFSKHIEQKYQKHRQEHWSNFSEITESAKYEFVFFVPPIQGRENPLLIPEKNFFKRKKITFATKVAFLEQM